MKKIRFVFCIALVAGLVSCNKQVTETEALKPISFRMDDNMSVDVLQSKAITDATAGNVDKIWVTATSGTAKSSETAFTALTNAEIALSSGSGSSAAYWPTTGTLNFYATNWNATHTLASQTSGVTCSVTNAGSASDDYIAGAALAVANGTTPVVFNGMKHIFSRLFDLKFYVSEGSEATITKVTVQPAKTTGTYSLTDGSWSNTAAGTASTVTITPTTTKIPGTSISKETATSVGQSNVDHTFVPGDVTINVEYTITRPGYTADFTKSATVALVAGQKSTVAGLLADDATPITFQITVAEWVVPDQPLNPVFN